MLGVTSQSRTGQGEEPEKESPLRARKAPLQAGPSTGEGLVVSISNMGQDSQSGTMSIILPNDDAVLLRQFYAIPSLVEKFRGWMQTEIRLYVTQMQEALQFASPVGPRSTPTGGTGPGAMSPRLITYAGVQQQVDEVTTLGTSARRNRETQKIDTKSVSRAKGTMSLPSSKQSDTMIQETKRKRKKGNSSDKSSTGQQVQGNFEKHGW